MRSSLLLPATSAQTDTAGQRRWRPGRWLAAAVLMLAAGPAFAASRNIVINAPKTAVTGSPVTVSVAVSTTTGSNEQIGFLHAQYSINGGATWVAFCFQEKLGPRATRSATIVAGPGGSKIIVRVRVAFRGGKAGDVDFAGNPIDWADSWDKWDEPPAKSATIAVEAL